MSSPLASRVFYEDKNYDTACEPGARQEENPEPILNHVISTFFPPPVLLLTVSGFFFSEGVHYHYTGWQQQLLEAPSSFTQPANGVVNVIAQESPSPSGRVWKEDIKEPAAQDAGT
ncbi:hypothetical protein CDAR_224561 [Caerostris darwini]|uniref:Uncharacterized protein n=1 Tax=Caerostris darwini TaxID=1538125 RepID=A0AAV4WXE9_9ARAC|nr:hypothetical protein CDAR_224561 [Caerostris darwini]